MSKIRWKKLNKKSSFKWALLLTLLLPFAALLNNHQAQALPANYNMGDFKNLAFHAPLTNNGISQLPADITVNGTTVSPSLRCEGKDATATDWACTGDTLSIAGTGTAPTTGASTPFTDDSESVYFNNGKYFAASNTSIGASGTDDIIIEFVIRQNKNTGDITGYRFFSSYLAASGYYALQNGSGGGYQFYIVGSTGQCFLPAPSAESGAWDHILIMLNVDEGSLDGAKLYINGVLKNSKDCSGIGTVSNDGVLSIGALTNGVVPWTGPIAEVAIYHSTDLFSAGATGAAEMAAIAKERFSLLTGITDIFDHTVTASRSSTAMSSITDSTCTTTELFNVGSNWTRTDCACDKNGERLCGARVEPGATNRVLQSQAFDDAAWAKRGTATATANSVTAPDGTMTADTIAGIGSATTNDLYQIVSGLNASAEYSPSFWIKRISTTGVVTIWNPVVGAPGGDMDVDLSALPDRWVHISQESSYSTVNTRATATSGGQGGLIFFASSGAPLSFYLWGAQLETGAVATSYIPTTTATVTRAADRLSWAFAAPSTGTIRYRLLMPDYTSAQEYIISLSDGTASNELLTYQHNFEAAAIYMLNGGVQQAFVVGTTDLTSNTVRTIHARWSSTNNDLFIDRVREGSPDTSATIPQMTMLRIGYSADGAISAPILISDLRVYNKQRTLRVVPVFHAPLTTDETDLFGHTATFSRASTATQSVTNEDCTTTTLSTVAANTLRIDCACDSSGERICGARVEPGATNLALQSQAFNVVPWSQGTTTTANQGNDRFGNTTLELLDNTAQTNYASNYQTATIPSTTVFTASVLADTDGASDVVSIRAQGCGTLSSCSCSSDRGTCATKTSGSNCAAYMTVTEPTRLSATATCGAAITSAIIAVQPGEYLASQGSALFGQAQLETGPVATSYIPTTTAAVTRAADAMSWAFAAPSTGTIRYRLLVPDHTNTTAFIHSLSDGTSNNRIQLYMHSTNSASPKVIVNAGGTSYVSLNGATDLSVDQIFTIHQQWSSTNNIQYVDRVAQNTPDTSATIPTTTTLYLGNYLGGISAPMLISDLRVDNGQVLR